MKRRSKCTAFLIVALALLLACALLAGCESKVTLKLVTYDGNFTVLEGKAGEIADFPQLRATDTRSKAGMRTKASSVSPSVRRYLKRTKLITPNG